MLLVVSTVTTIDASFNSVETTYMESLTPEDWAYVLREATENVLIGYMAYSGADYCKEYRKAAAECTFEALLWIASAWANTGGVYLSNGGLEILNDMWGCLRAVDAKYQPCCPK